MKSIARTVLGAACFAAVALAESSVPAAERAVLFYVDGLHPEAIDRFDLTNLKALRDQGTSADEAVMIFPWHPTTGEYGRLHTTSLPNPMTMAGTLFLRDGLERQPMLQDQFPRKAVTAISVGSKAYDTLTPGFSLVHMLDVADAKLMEDILSTLDRHDPLFYRIQLQDVGRAGMALIGDAARGGRVEIWDDPKYAAAAREADRQVGRFMEKMKALGRWDSTLFVFMSDGQGRHGWHLPADEESWRTPLIMTGPGVRVGARIPYAEIIDVIPTMAAALGVKAPNPGPGSGRILREVYDAAAAPMPVRSLRRLNGQIVEYLRLASELRLASSDVPTADYALLAGANDFLTRAAYGGEPFYGLDRVTEWHRAGSIEALLAANERALGSLRAAVERLRAGRTARVTR